METPQASSIFSFEPKIKEANLATSIEEPPPNPITPVAFIFFPTSIAFKSVLIDGSASTSWNISTKDENFLNSFRVGSVNFNNIKSLSVINKILGPNFLETSSAHSFDIPLPNLIPEVVLNIKLSLLIKT